MKKNIAGLGIEPQNCKMSWIEIWCLSPLDHEISIGKWLIYQYINIGKSSTKPPKCRNLVLFFWFVSGKISSEDIFSPGDGI